MEHDLDQPLKSVPFAITNPERIPAQRYYDEHFYKLECERLWLRVWQMACRLEEIPAVGDFVEYQILDKSVIIVRTQSGIKAFHNSCRHRGVRLVEGQGSRAKGFTCPFHGWRWDIDGECKFVFAPKVFSEENLQRSDLSLVTCRVEVWGGCAFINFDDNAPPLLECIKPYAQRLDVRNVEKLKVEWWRSTVLPTNWKLAMEAFMEGYHVMRTHPQLLHATVGGERASYGPENRNTTVVMPFKSAREFVDETIRSMRMLSEGMAGMIQSSEVAIAESLRDMELPDDLGAAAMKWYGRLNEEIVAQGRARGLAVPDLSDIAMNGPRASGVEFCFPNYFLLPAFGSMASYRIRPLGPERCLFELWSLTLYSDDEERPRPVAPAPMAHDDPSWPPIPKQDYSNLPRQQLGLHAQGFEYMRLSRAVEGLISNYQRVIDGFLGGIERDRLAKAVQIVCDGYDSPIKDVGF